MQGILLVLALAFLGLRAHLKEWRTKESWHVLLRYMKHLLIALNVLYFFFFHHLQLKSSFYFCKRLWMIYWLDPLDEQFPIGIDSDRFIRALELSPVKYHIKELQERFAGRKVHSSIKSLITMMQIFLQHSISIARNMECLNYFTPQIFCHPQCNSLMYASS